MGKLHLVKKKTLKKQRKLKRVFDKLESALSKARSRESMLRNGKKKLKRFKKIQRAKENIIEKKLQKLSRKLLFVDKKEAKLKATLNRLFHGKTKPRTHRLKGQRIIGKDKGKLRKKLKALLRAKRVGLKVVTLQKRAQKTIKYNLNRLIRKRLKIPPTQKKKLKALDKSIAKERSHLKRVRNAIKKTSKKLPLLTKKIASLKARLYKRTKNNGKDKTTLRKKLKVLLHAKRIELKVVTFQKKAQKKIKRILNQLILKKLKIPLTQKKKFKALAKKIAKERRNLKRVRNAIKKTLKKLPLLIKKIAQLKARLGGRKSGSSKRSKNNGKDKTLLRKKLKVLLHAKRIELKVATFQKKAQKKIKRILNQLILKKLKIPPTQKKKFKALAKKIAEERRNLKRVRNAIKKTLKKLPLLTKKIALLRARLGGKSGVSKKTKNNRKDKKTLKKKLKVLLHAKRMELKIVTTQKRAQKKIKRNLNGLINKKRKVPPTQKKKLKALAKKIAKERRNLKRVRNAIKKASKKLPGLTKKIALRKARLRGRKSRGGSSKRTKDRKKKKSQIKKKRPNKRRKRYLLIHTRRIKKRARAKMARLEKTLDKFDKGLATLARRKSRLRPGQKKLRIVLDKRIATFTRQRKSKSQVMKFLGIKIARLNKRIARLKEGDVNSYKKGGGKNRLKKNLRKLRLSTKRILRKTIQLKAKLKKNNDKLADFLNQKSRLRPNQKKMKIELARTIALYRKKGKKIRLLLKKISKKLSKMRRAMKSVKRRLREKIKRHISKQKRFSKKISQLKKETKKLGKVISKLRKRKSGLRPHRKKKRIALGKKIASLTVKRKRFAANMKKVSGEAAKLKTAIRALRAKLAGKRRSASPPLATNLRGKAEPRIDAVIRPTEISKRRAGRSVENTESDGPGSKKDYTVGVHKSRHLNSLNLKTTGDEIVKSRRRNMDEMDSDSKEKAAEAERGTRTSQSDESAKRLPESPTAGSSSILDSRFKMFEEWKDAQERHEEGPFLLKLAKHNRQNLVRLGWTQKEDLRNFLMKLENELASTSPFSKTEEQKWRLFFLLTQRNIAVSIRHFEQRLALRLRSLGQPGKHRLQQVMGIIALGT